LRIGTQAARRAGDPVECFYARGRLWTRANPDDAWSLNGRQDDDQASGREARDPAAILEVIDAVTGVNARDRTEEARPGRESELEATADLTLIADKLPSALRRALGDKPNRNWVTRVPVRAEIDDAGRLVRLSYAPMPPRPGSEEAELWTTVAFSDFGVEVPEPADLS
jgi:hypothetical protein